MQYFEKFIVFTCGDPNSGFPNNLCFPLMVPQIPEGHLWSGLRKRHTRRLEKAKISDTFSGLSSTKKYFLGAFRRVPPGSIVVPPGSVVVPSGTIVVPSPISIFHRGTEGLSTRQWISSVPETAFQSIPLASLLKRRPQAAKCNLNPTLLGKIAASFLIALLCQYVSATKKRGEGLECW